MESNRIRREFLRFFEERGHKIVPSSSLIPNDPTLLLTNAGMNQFKPYFMGLQEPPYPRAATCQKVFRASDIENVGHTDRHETFFEMLGNFSFGDYFKREAAGWGWELVTEVYGIEPDRLWVTVFESDDEAADIWADEVGVPRERIVRRDRVDNYWWMHVAGPAGPCSEIYVDRGSTYGPDGGPAVDEERFCEIWNLVFMQHEVDQLGEVVRDLPKKNIDTGSSLERVAMVLQGVDNVFLTDVLRPLLDVVQETTGVKYGSDDRTDVSLRVIAEHGRATTFLIADGVLPSNEGRGYVLRRMIRRLVTHARRMGVDHDVMPPLVEQTVEVMGEAYPELVANRAFILQVATSEEERFAGTYRQGLALLDEAVSNVGGSKAANAEEATNGVLPGDVAFRLHDTHGFPLELTLELAQDQGLAVDTDRFAELMEEQRRRAKEAARKGDVAEGPLGQVAQETGPTEFLGYEHVTAEARVAGLVRDGQRAETAGEGRPVRLILDRTPFYAEGGGQVGDQGLVRSSGALVRVTDTRPGPGGIIVHDGVVERGEVRAGDEVSAEVDADRRAATARSHTATHVLHHTVRHALGEHARQAGSLVAPGRLRFDFTHFEPVPRGQLEEIEAVVNRRLADDSSVRAYETTQEFAKSQGAMALFGEKYGDLVRVVEVGDYSIELCGGTHVHHTGEVALVRLLHEASIGSGFRRVEALTGPDALRQVNVERRLLEEVMEAVQATDPSAAPDRVRQAVARVKELEGELGKLRREEQRGEIDRLAGSVQDVDGARLLVHVRQGASPGDLRELALRLRSKLSNEPAAVVLVGTGEGKTTVVAALTSPLVSRGVTAASLAQPLAAAAGGNAGGRPDLAMGGGPNDVAPGEAPVVVRQRLLELLGA